MIPCAAWVMNHLNKLFTVEAMNRQIIKDQQIVNDTWVHLTDEDELPNSGNIIISLQRWQTQQETLKEFAGQLGLKITGDIEMQSISKELYRFALVAIDFKEFKDGRGYSCARLLRQRYDYEGELRATGNILKDQIFYLHRCGFNAFEIDGDSDIRDAVKSFADFTVTYQPAVI